MNEGVRPAEGMLLLSSQLSQLMVMGGSLHQRALSTVVRWGAPQGACCSWETDLGAAHQARVVTDWSCPKTA